MADHDDQNLCSMVTEPQADTIRALFVHSGRDMTEIKPEDIDSAMTVKKAIEERALIVYIHLLLDRLSVQACRWLQFLPPGTTRQQDSDITSCRLYIHFNIYSRCANSACMLITMTVHQY